MKKVLVLVLMIFVIAGANAQLRIGVKAGAQMTDLNNGHMGMILPELEDISTYDIGPNLGYRLGIDVQYMFTDHVGIASGLSCSVFGLSATMGLDSYIGDQHATTYSEVMSRPAYLQLPFNFLYKFNLSSKVKLYPSVGIYLGYGIGGKTTMEVPETIISEIVIPSFTYEEKYFRKETEFRRFDAGLSGGLNLDINRFVISIFGDYGLVNMHKGEKIKNNKGNVSLLGWGLSVGYFFNIEDIHLR
jgi:hypothetical protein